MASIALHGRHDTAAKGPQTRAGVPGARGSVIRYRADDPIERTQTNNRKERMTGATVPSMATSAKTDIGTIALADQLIHLRERVPLSEVDVMAATGADAATVAGWIERRVAPVGEQAVRLSELVAAVERLEVTTKADAIPEWLRREVPALDGKTPLQTLAAGGYERIAGFAEDLIYPTFT